MSSDESRRFTDREVALVLKKASEIEEAEAKEGGRGLSLRDLQEIAREVGISAEAVATAVVSLERTRGGEVSLAGAPLVRRAVHAVEGALNQEAMARLIRVVDERADGAGTVSEALGSVRWTGSGRFRSTQISLTPEAGETVIQVVEKAAPHLRPLFHLIPAAWGAMLALGALAPLALPAAGAAATAVGGLVVLAGAVAGTAAGRLAWSWMSWSSGRRVEHLAADLADAAREATGRNRASSPD
jgi:hypothetical protein